MKIPPNFKDLLPLPLETLRQIAQVVGQPQLLNKLKEAAEYVGGKDATTLDSIQQMFQQANKWAEMVVDVSSWTRQTPAELVGINGTGELFTSRWTNGTVSQQSAILGAKLLSSQTLSNLDTGVLKPLILGLTGASEVLVAVNTSAALHALALSEPANRQWLLPRVDCVRPFRFGTNNSGSIRTPLELSKKPVLEVGSNQECTLEDFAQAKITGEPVLLSVSSPRCSEALSKSHIDALRSGREATNGTWIEILYNGSLHTVEEAPELAISILDRWQSGPDILLVPCDLWLGGPEACLILTREKTEWWAALERTLQCSGLEASAWTQSLLHSVFKETESRENWEQSKVGEAISTSLDNMRFRAQRIASQLESSSALKEVSILEKECRIGMGIWADAKLESIVLAIKPATLSASALAEKLAVPEPDNSSKAVWCNVLSDSIEIVLRSVDPADDSNIVARFLALDQPKPPKGDEIDP